MKKWIFIAGLFLANMALGQEATGEIIGTVVNEIDGVPITRAHLFIIDQDRKYQAFSDVDGRFRISAVPAGTYTMNVRFNADTLQEGIKVIVPMDGICQAGIIKFSTVKQIDKITVKKVANEMKLEYGFLPIKTLTSEEIKKSPDKFSIAKMLTTMSTEIKVDENGELMFRGARKGDMVYMLDGIKGREISNIPSCAIGRMMVYTGGIPAKYGDTLGGVVVLESLSYFDLLRAWQREQKLKENN